MKLKVSLREDDSTIANKIFLDKLQQISSFDLADVDATITTITGKSISQLQKEAGTTCKNEVDFRRVLLKEYMKTHLVRHLSIL